MAIEDVPRTSLAAAADADSRTEHPCWFRAGSHALFGILTMPMAPPRNVGVVFLEGASDRNRFSVKLARRLAADGFHVLRFDYHGSGESTGAAGKLALEQLFTDDLLAAVEVLLARGVEHVVLVGRCFGARTALSAVAGIAGLRGMALVSMPLYAGRPGLGAGRRWALEEIQDVVRDGFRPGRLLGLLNPAHRRRRLRRLWSAVRSLIARASHRRPDGSGALAWLSPSVLRWLEEVVGRGIPVLFLYGATEVHHRDFLEAQRGELGAIAARGGDRWTVALVDGPLHNLTTLEVQEAALARIREWLGSLAS